MANANATATVQYLPLSVAAIRFGLSTASLRRMIAEKHLAKHKAPRGRTLVSVEEVERLLAPPPANRPGSHCESRACPATDSQSLGE